ncbi:class I SAM-dependent methyltransferase [Pontibacter sp. MBLB2868]|uniref:class I SAM-dependent methyltransferase n=1 Tax=Pontibacter sp. MBLB2868 TaxID=3451555 RepID=UPI003F74B468
MFHIPLTSLREHFGEIDIYLFDQLLKGRVTKGMKLLDAGCGNGRNIKYLMQSGVKVYGADASAEAIAQVKQMAAALAPTLPSTNFVIADLASLPFPDQTFDFVACSAVLHFARNIDHFNNMIQELWRVLDDGGTLFCRFSTTIGMEGKLHLLGDGHYQMPHGPSWFLANEEMIQKLEQTLNAERLEPLKTVLVEQERSMTTWVLRK